MLYLYFVPFIGFQIKYDDDDTSVAEPSDAIAHIVAVRPLRTHEISSDIIGAV